MADQQQPGLLANILAVAGFFILIVIIVWGAYHLLRLTGTGISSLFSRWGNNQEITLTAPNAPVASGRTFDLTWNHSTEEAGSYAFLYQCKPGFRFEAKTGESQNAIPCGGAYSIGDTKSLTLIPTLSGTTSLEVPLSIIFLPSATTTSEQRPQGNAVITVIPGASANTGSNGTNGSQSSGTGTTSGSTGSTVSQGSSGSTGTGSTKPATPGVPDLRVTILAIGAIDPAGNFIARAPIHQDEIAAVKFDIANIGTASTGSSWYFTAQLPVAGGYTFTSQSQMNLTPGSHIENILRFKPIQSGGGTVVVNVDPGNAVRESNESNNSASQYASGPTWQQYNTYYQPYVY